MPDHGKFRISWTVPIPMIASVMLSAGGILWAIASWKAQVENQMTIATFQRNANSNRLTQMEANIANNGTLAERVKGVEVNVEALKTQSQNIEMKIDRLIDRGVRK